MTGLSRSAAQLRQDFDRSFADAVVIDAEPREDFLALRLGGVPHAIRMAEVSHLQPLSGLTQLPGPVGELLGVIGFRGAIVPVYDLRALLGHATQEPAPWLFISRASPVGFAFDVFDGHLRAPRSATARQAGAAPTHSHVHEVLRSGDQVRPVVSMASVLDAVRARVQQGLERSV